MLVIVGRRDEVMIVVSNRVQGTASRIETFVEGLSTSHGIENQPGFLELRLMHPVEAEGFVTTTTSKSLEASEAWRTGEEFERATRADRPARRSPLRTP